MAPMLNDTSGEHLSTTPATMDSQSQHEECGTKGSAEESSGDKSPMKRLHEDESNDEGDDAETSHSNGLFESESPQKRPRGRPRRDSPYVKPPKDDTPKKRGRPRIHPPKDPNAEKRPRGRPPTTAKLAGSPSKRFQMRIVLSPTEMSEKRPRGRPRLHPLDKKSRGRPRSFPLDPNTSFCGDSADAEDVLLGDDDDVTLQDKPLTLDQADSSDGNPGALTDRNITHLTPKRRPGRPRIHPRDDTPKEKKPRGRPRIHPKVDKPKGPRGRPRKSVENDFGSARKQKGMVIRKPAYLNTSGGEALNDSLCFGAGSAEVDRDSENDGDDVDNSMGLVISNVTTVTYESDCIEVSSSSDDEDMQIGHLQHAGEDEYMVIINENQNSADEEHQDPNATKDDDFEVHEMSDSGVSSGDVPAAFNYRAGSISNGSAVYAN